MDTVMELGDPHIMPRISWLAEKLVGIASPPRTLVHVVTSFLIHF